MTVIAILKCGNSSCKNYLGFVNEPELDFADEEEQESWIEAYGQGAEDPEDFCPSCGVLATLEDVVDKEMDENG